MKGVFRKKYISIKNFLKITQTFASSFQDIFFKVASQGRMNDSEKKYLLEWPVFSKTLDVLVL